MKTHLQCYRFHHEAMDGLREFMRNNEDAVQRRRTVTCADGTAVRFDYASSLDCAELRFQGLEFDSVEYCGSDMPDRDACNYIRSRVRPETLRDSGAETREDSIECRQCEGTGVREHEDHPSGVMCNCSALCVLVDTVHDEITVNVTPAEIHSAAQALREGALLVREKSLQSMLLSRHDPAREIKLTPRTPEPYAPTADDIAACKAKTEHATTDSRWGPLPILGSRMQTGRVQSKVPNSGNWAEMSAAERGTAIHKAVEADIAAGLIKPDPGWLEKLASDAEPEKRRLAVNQQREVSERLKLPRITGFEKGMPPGEVQMNRDALRCVTELPGGWQTTVTVKDKSQDAVRIYVDDILSANMYSAHYIGVYESNRRGTWVVYFTPA